MNPQIIIEELKEINQVVPHTKLVVAFKRREQTDKSLLRYPGGKTRGVDEIKTYLPHGINKLCSPFFGGGSLEINMAANGVKVYGYDVFNPLVEFWQCVLKYPNQLADLVQTFYPLSKDMFYELQKTQTKFSTKLERAAVYYVLNRSSFSGSTLSGGMSPDHPRFTLTSIERLRKFYNTNIQIKRLSFEESINAHPRTFLYLDPPYLIESTLYGKNGNAHKGFDHQRLSKIIKKRCNWIMSYNDCPEIRDLYKSHLIISPTWKYGMSNDKSSKEVLIFSRKLTSKWQPKPNQVKHLNTH
jgi:DNA adenine methylase